MQKTKRPAGTLLVPLTLAMIFFFQGQVRAQADDADSKWIMKLTEYAVVAPGLIFIEFGELAYYLEGSSHLGFGSRIVSGHIWPSSADEDSDSIDPDPTVFPVFLDYNLRDAISPPDYQTMLNHSLIARAELGFLNQTYLDLSIRATAVAFGFGVLGRAGFRYIYSENRIGAYIGIGFSLLNIEFRGSLRDFRFL